jgi:hypothetical protein
MKHLKRVFILKNKPGLFVDYTQILIRTKYNFSLIKITEDSDEWFYVSVTDNKTTYYKADQIDGLLLLLEYLLERFI